MFIDTEEIIEEGDSGFDCLPLEILEAIFQITPASQHGNISSVCKYWNDAVQDPATKRQVLVDLSNIESAWQTALGNSFARTACSNSSSALQAYGHALGKWISQFLDRRTRSLVLSDGLCNHSHIFWPELKTVLTEICPLLRSLTFQNGQVQTSVLRDLPSSVKKVRLDNVRILKRHAEENYTECVLDLRQTASDVVRLSTGNWKCSTTDFIDHHNYLESLF
ncbi:hypothetical protein BV898_03175 [Hypsibius exemplaris]|uniref:F-box domain-containing protein n=1 Tax=Hypsibius exemplaris TaxID=2072580 RepID=A0A1W0X5C5_HYPEX|nr:hypothetical protein BV898_03175 [Hypsibius exemplaris]